MELSELCTQETRNGWRHKYGNTYNSVDIDGENITIFEYCIPLPEHREAEVKLRYNLTDDDMPSYYRNLAIAVQHQFDSAKYLAENQVQSVISYKSVQTVKQGRLTKIFLATQEVTPLLDSPLFTDSINTITALEVILRLATTLRDFGKLSMPFLHRGIDVEELYMTRENKILLGGFFYSSWGNNEPPAYLPQHPANIPHELLEGEIGTAECDLYMLSSIMWSVFAHCPLGVELPTPLVMPAYASDKIMDIISYGLFQGKDIMVFRKMLLDCRKKILKEEIENPDIPLVAPYKSTLRKKRVFASEKIEQET